QHVLMEEAGGARAHERAGDLGRRALDHERAVLRYAGPVAIIADEAPGAALRRIKALIGSGLREVAIDAAAQRLDPVAEHPGEQHGAVLAKGADELWRDGHLSSPSPRFGQSTRLSLLTRTGKKAAPRRCAPHDPS